MNHAARIVDRALDAVGSLDATAAVEMFADDGVLELPNRGGGLPRVLSGRAEVAGFLRILPKVLRDMPLVDRRFYETTDPTTVVVEYRSEGTTRAGKPYRNRYMAVLVVDAHDRIALWREYFDPTVIEEAFGTAG